MTTSGSGAGIFSVQSTVVSAGLLAVGGIVSSAVPQELQTDTIQLVIITFTVCVNVSWFPQLSVTVQVLVMV